MKQYDKTNNGNEGFRYILCYSICPTHAPDERIEELINFCLESRTEEVMLLFTAEELTCGHPTTKELIPICIQRYNKLSIIH